MFMALGDHFSQSVDTGNTLLVNKMHVICNNLQKLNLIEMSLPQLPFSWPKNVASNRTYFAPT